MNDPRWSMLSVGLAALAILAAAAVLFRDDPAPASKPDPRIAELEARIQELESARGESPVLDELKARIRQLEQNPATVADTSPSGWNHPIEGLVGDTPVVTPETFRGTPEEKAKLESLNLDPGTVMVAQDLFRALERDWEKLEQIEDPKRADEVRAHLARAALPKFRHVFGDQYDAFLAAFPEWRERVE